MDNTRAAIRRQNNLVTWLVIAVTVWSFGAAETQPVQHSVEQVK